MSNITPNEILEKDFKKKLHGYDPIEVKEFLENVANYLSSLIKENNLLKSRVLTQKAQIESYIKKEAELMNALVTAQKFSDDLKGQAEKEADFILQRARLEAESLIIDAKKEYESILRNAKFDSEKIIRDANRKVINLEARITELKRIREEYIFRLRSTLDWFNRMLLQEEMDLKNQEYNISDNEPIEQEEFDKHPQMLAYTSKQYGKEEIDNPLEEQDVSLNGEKSEEIFYTEEEQVSVKREKPKESSPALIDEIDDDEIASWFQSSDEKDQKEKKNDPFE